VGKRLLARLRRLPWWGKALLGLAGLAGTGLCAYAAIFAYSQTQSDSNTYIRRWFDDPASRDALRTAQREPCNGAPFILPSDGLIGLLWRDPAAPYSVLRRHTGIDIFGDGAPGEVPVYAAYGGYLTRLPDWVSSVIIRHDDPLQPGRTIWTYYTHMASEDGDSFIMDAFPPGAREVWVEQGTLLGYQGEYAGAGLFPIGMHVHFSIVKSEADGSFKNESDLSNTLDPSPYLGLPLNIATRPARPIRCTG
jgi:murein DD-endopeptidase MepM/ murein hydrolase activator NlpD